MDEMQIPQRMHQGDNIQNIYSRILTNVMPYIERTVDNLPPAQMLSDGNIDNLTNNIISESNILSMVPNNISPEEIFTMVRMLLIMDIENIETTVTSATATMEDLEDTEDDAIPAIAPYGFGFDPRFGFFPPFFLPPFFFPGPRPRRRRGMPPRRPSQRPPQRPGRR